jgi:transposase-like protein
MAYSVDFRRKAIEFVDKGHTGKELKEVFGIYPSEIAKWRKLLAETGSLEPQYKETRSGKIDMTKLKTAVEEQPDAYLHELAKQFGCTKQAIFYALKRLKKKKKKNIYIR